jgi:hypothetical protein
MKTKSTPNKNHKKGPKTPIKIATKDNTGLKYACIILVGNYE